MRNVRPPMPSRPTKVNPANFKPLGSPIETKHFPINRGDAPEQLPTPKKSKQR